ncbi:MAG TPA: hypothetical protein VE127_16775, partial [Solirubrobacteraceae bacterium]|nr:hypothetical protein [Solirubrobacteraceae bacterium]
AGGELAEAEFAEAEPVAAVGAAVAERSAAAVEVTTDRTARTAEAATAAAADEGRAWAGAEAEAGAAGTGAASASDRTWLTVEAARPPTDAADGSESACAGPAASSPTTSVVAPSSQRLSAP